MRTPLLLMLLCSAVILHAGCSQPEPGRHVLDFNDDWKFQLGDSDRAELPDYDDGDWRRLNLPHDWSIEGEFSPDHPAGVGGGALPGGVGWYRKTFTVDENRRGKPVFIEFDGVYQDSDVWINGEHLGNRPNGYISFRYELTPHLNYGEGENVVAVRVDNSLQPNSRWYSGSGIYRNVRLVQTEPVHVDYRGTWITTPEIAAAEALVAKETTVRNAGDAPGSVSVTTRILDADGRQAAYYSGEPFRVDAGATGVAMQDIRVPQPRLWSDTEPNLYTAVTEVYLEESLVDRYETTFGIREFRFDAEHGFFLNGEPVKIRGVCNHHDLGALGAAVNTRAIERQLEIMQGMGVNAIRTAHNPPAPELLELADRMGFIIQNEIFDAWAEGKAEYDYHLHFDEWHERDLRDFVLRDRNHPSVIMWSIGNEILEQWDSTGVEITRNLAGIVRELDDTRPITAGLNHPQPDNYMIRSGELDLIGYNYEHEEFENFPKTFPGEKFIASETTSALATRGEYDMPSDSIRRWPYDWRVAFTGGNPDHTVSAYDNVSTPWGSTHMESLRPIMEHDFLSGMFIWTGFDYLGEPTPYGWPSRSSYFGIVDLAGFPKDAYYLYKSVWTEEPVLHIFPHWNWEDGDIIDVWAYTNYDEVELFINDESQGLQRLVEGDMHLMWRVAWEPGTVRAVGRRYDQPGGSESGGPEIADATQPGGQASADENGNRPAPHERIVEIHTAGDPAQLRLTADRDRIVADGRDLSFVTVEVLDEKGRPVPWADDLIRFHVDGPGSVIAVDNGSPTSHEPFQADYRKAFNGKALAIVQSAGESGEIVLTAASGDLQSDRIVITAK
ncbi:glycoside hydrolase family 2 TIM barrel-domain containing protein [Balneolales bacterium ANBcel1]|nr:glycoside hydrolase family 2 TIM barrel-domain containing protein [Balneolales bacterium ANBcel1]